MSSSPRQLILLVSLLPYALVLSAGVEDEARAVVQELRIGLTPGRTRVVFDLSAPTSYRLSVDSNSGRVIVDLPSARDGAHDFTPSLDGSGIKQIITAYETDQNIQYIFELEQDSEAHMFALDPYQGRGHRLVLDLHKKNMAATATADLSDISSEPHNVDQAAASSAHSTEMPTTSIPNDNTKTAPEITQEAGEWSGYLSFDARLFFQSPAHPRQDTQNASLAFEPEYNIDWANGRSAFSFRPFFRLDANDDERTHADVRELNWRVKHEDMIFRAGIDVDFWGVTESQHLVDIINQTDLVENIDGEDKLGQPMLNLDYLSEWGTWQFYLLPYFRERTFPGEDGRLRSNPAVDTGDTEYESGSEEKHIDFAFRWSRSIADWDIGVAHFSGTSREPLLILGESSSTLKIVPLYLQIDQTSLDIQATKDAWLWKLEAIYNKNKLDNYYAFVGGFEYTRFGVAGSSVDLGYLVEYNYDDRGDRSTTALEEDIYLGLRLTGNDLAGTRALAGVVVDVDSQSTFGSIEAVRRLDEAWLLSLELRFFANIDESNNILVDEKEKLFFIKDDDYIEIRLFRYF